MNNGFDVFDFYHVNIILKFVFLGKVSIPEGTCSKRLHNFTVFEIFCLLVYLV